MDKNSTYIPMYSTPILYDKPKYVVCEGFLFEMHGMLISECIESGEYIGLNRTVHRTLLEGEQLHPFPISDDEDPGFEILHSAPDFTKEDFRKMFLLVTEDDIDRLMRPFETGKFRLDKPKGTLDVEVRRSGEKLVCDSKYFWIELEETRWIPGALGDLFTIQSVLDCTFKFYTEAKNVDPSTIKFMQQITDNRAKYGLFESPCRSDDPSMNDGEFTYHTSGLIEPMTREKYIELVPDSFEGFERLSGYSQDEELG